MDYSASARDYGYRDFSLGPGYFFIEYGNFPDSGSYGDGNRYGYPDSGVEAEKRGRAATKRGNSSKDFSGRGRTHVAFHCCQ